MQKKLIAWDLGATKCAAAVVEFNGHSNSFNCLKSGSIKIRSCESLDELSAQIENMLDVRMQDADAICIGAAGQYDGSTLQLEKGYPYPMEFKKLAERHNWPRFDVLHDYSPIVCSTFTNYLDKPSNVKHLNQATLHPQGRRVALGIGTGVGMKDGVLFQNGDFWLGTNEMGHIGITTPPLADRECRQRHDELLKFLRSEGIIQEHEALTFEKILANDGMARIHAFFDRNAKDKTSEEIGDMVRNGQAPETLATFAWYFGLLVGTVQLSFMPDGGIWLTGGVTLSHMEIFEQEAFFKGIEASPTYYNLRQQFPLGVLCGADHAFIGAAYYASKKLI